MPAVTIEARDTERFTLMNLDTGEIVGAGSLPSMSSECAILNRMAGYIKYAVHRKWE